MSCQIDTWKEGRIAYKAFLWPCTGDSLYKDCPAGKALGPEGIMLEFVNARGLKLASYVFPAKGEAKALVILVHGHGARYCHHNSAVLQCWHLHMNSETVKVHCMHTRMP